MTRSRYLQGAWLDSLIVAVCALAVYVATLAPTIAAGDSAELTAAVWTLGVTHPTGYPLYTLLGHAFVRLFAFGTVAYRMNLFSAVAMAAGIALFYGAARRLTGRRLPSMAAALLLAFTPCLWSQALIAEVYALHVALSCAVLLAGLEWDRRGDRRWLCLTAFLYGLCFTHHMMSVLMAPGLLYLAVTSRHRAQLLPQLPVLLLSFLAPLALYLYLPWAARRDQPLNWGDPRTWDNLVAHVTGRQYRHLMFHSPPHELLSRAKQYPVYLIQQFGYPLLVLGLVGLWQLFRTRRRWFWGTGLLYVTGLVYGLNYDIYDVAIYFIPGNCIFALWIAVGLAWVVRLCVVRLASGPDAGHIDARRTTRRHATRWRLGWAACVALPAMTLWSHWAETSQHTVWWPMEYGRGYLASLEPNAIVFAGGDDVYFPLLYTKYVEGRRPDVVLFTYNDALYPERHRLIERLEPSGLRVPASISLPRQQGRPRFDYAYLRALLDLNVGRRPVYIVGPDKTLADPPMRWALAPFACVQTTNMPGWRLFKTAPALEQRMHPSHPARITFGDTARFAGYDAEPFQREGVTLLRVRYYWDLLKPWPRGGMQAWVLFTDERGNYQIHPRGGPTFHNIHSVGQGRPLVLRGFPQRICEDFDVVVPPADVNRQRRLRVALAVGGRFLPPIEAPGARFADAGIVGTSLLAADQTPGSQKNARCDARGADPVRRRGSASL